MDVSIGGRKMYKRFNSVKFEKACDGCGSSVTFVKNQSGQWLCVDVLVHRGSPVWMRGGNNNNFIGTHQCSKAYAAIPVESALQTLHKVNACFTQQLLDAVRAGDFSMVTDESRMSRLINRLRERVQRRFRQSGLNVKDLQRNSGLAERLQKAGIEVNI
jgi:hypothetical protein